MSHHCIWHGRDGNYRNKPMKNLAVAVKVKMKRKVMEIMTWICQVVIEIDHGMEKDGSFAMSYFLICFRYYIIEFDANALLLK